MVLHSFMLNPWSFLEDCIKFGRMGLWTSGFPFEIVDQCIDNQTLEYFPGDEAMYYFSEKTSLSWDNLLDSPDTLVECPKCNDSVRVPWTAGTVGKSPDKLFEDFHGFADKHFHATCPNCRFEINHEQLKVLKFRKDVMGMVNAGIPMPGTFYNLNGVPQVPPDPSNNRMLFPNRFLKAIDQEIFTFTDARLGSCQSIGDFRDMLGRHIDDKNTILKAKPREGVSLPSVYPGEKRALRRMMARYADNNSPFATDLVGAVIRQGTFINKMDHIDWLNHSPALLETMRRFIKKYVVFFNIMAKNPKHMAVPTLDVDLVWHTHQLLPRRYFRFSTSITEDHCHREIFVNHDDKVDELKLADGFEWTSKSYTKETHGGIYSECICWYCEATRVHEHQGHGIFRSSAVNKARDNIDNLHKRKGMSPDIEKNAHISAHNAISTSAVSERDVKTVQLRSNYEKACRRAAKRKSNISKTGQQQDDAKGNSVLSIWGYPLPVSDYVPFMSDPGVHNDAYAGDPTCSTTFFEKGGDFSCVAGTCTGAGGASACSSVGLYACASGGGAGCGSASTSSFASGDIGRGFGGVAMNWPFMPGALS